MHNPRALQETLETVAKSLNLPWSNYKFIIIKCSERQQPRGIRAWSCHAAKSFRTCVSLHAPTFDQTAGNYSIATSAQHRKITLLRFLTKLRPLAWCETVSHINERFMAEKHAMRMQRASVASIQRAVANCLYMKEIK